jgi:quercetin dioxygenase-like cupin family protein
MQLFRGAGASLLTLLCATYASAQPGSAYVPHEKVQAALLTGGVLVDAPQVKVAGFRRGQAGPLSTQKGTTIIYVTDGQAVFAAGTRSQALTRGDVLVIPAGLTQSLTSVAPSISYLQVSVPVIAAGATAEVVYADRNKVAATMKKAGPLADAPNLRVSGGYRTGPYAPADYRPATEVHTDEGDLFFIIEGRATQVLGGKVLDEKQTAVGQLRGSKIEGGQTYRLSQGDVMWVPAGMPHWFPDIPDPLSYLLVKVFY